MFYFFNVYVLKHETELTTGWQAVKAKRLLMLSCNVILK